MSIYSTILYGKMKRLLVVILGCTILMIACNQIEQSRSFDDLLSEVKVNIEIPDFDENSVLNCSDVFSSVEYVPLDSELSNICEITKLNRTPKGDYIVYDRRNLAIIRFDNNGRFVNYIGEQGHASNEYIKPIDVVYDPYNDQMLVWDNPRKKIMIYNINGSFISDLDIPWYTGVLSVVDNEHLLVCTDNLDSDKSKLSDGAKYEFVLIKRDGTIEKSFEGTADLSRGFQLSLDKTFSGECDNINCHMEYSPIVYKFVDKELKPFYGFYFKGNGMPKEWLSYDYEKYKSVKSTNKDVMYCYRFFDTPNYYVMNIIKDMIYFCVQSHEPVNNVIHYGNRLVNDLTGDKIIDNNALLYINLILTNVIDNKCYFVVEPTCFQELLLILQQKKADMQFTHKGNLSECEDIERAIEFCQKFANNFNPILVVCTLK